MVVMHRGGTVVARLRQLSFSRRVIGFFVFWCLSLYVIMTISSSYFLLVFYFIFFLFIIIEVVSPPSELVVYSSDLSLDGVLVPLELLMCGVSSGPSATKS